MSQKIALFEGYDSDCTNCGGSPGYGGLFGDTTPQSVGLIGGAVAGAYIATKAKPGETASLVVGAILGGILGRMVGGNFS